jgi:hypothetical protein
MELVRQHVPEWPQSLLEEEVTEALGRLKSQRRSQGDGAAGSRSGYGKPRRLTLSSGTIMRRCPRVRRVAERLASRMLPLFKRHAGSVGRLLSEWYGHGLSAGALDQALRGLSGQKACGASRCGG